MKRIILSIIALAKLFYLCSAIEISNNQLIESFTFDKEFNNVVISKPQTDDSGTLSMITKKLPEINMTEIIAFDGIENQQKYFLENESCNLISQYGEYYISRDELEYKIRDKYGNIYYTINRSEGNMIDISCSGYTVFHTWDFIKLKITDCRGNISSANFDFSNKKSKQLCFSPFLWKDKLKACLVGQLFEECSAIYPEGSRLFFFDENFNISHFIGVSGSMCIPNGVIHNDYIVYESYSSGNGLNIHNSETHICYLNKEILQLDGSIISSTFSPDGKLLLLNLLNNRIRSCYIVDLEKGDVINKLTPSSGISSIANKGFPYIATFKGRNGFEIINYQSNEILMSDTIPFEANELASTPFIKKIQLSGNGKEVTIFMKNKYMKYKLLNN